MKENERGLLRGALFLFFVPLVGRAFEVSSVATPECSWQRLGAERGVGDCGSTVVAEDGGRIDGVSTGVAAVCCGCGCRPHPRVQT
jgi:hypothetical protein